MAGWYQESIYNLTNNIALKGMVQHFQENPWKWLLYEISPRFYKYGGFSWGLLWDEFVGWGWHLGIGFSIMILFLGIAHFTKWSATGGLFVITGIAVFVEIAYMANERFYYFNPINHVLDVGFYVLGGYSLFYIWNYRKKITRGFFKLPFET